MNRQPTPAPRRFRGEAGQLLPLALAFMVLFGVAISAVLGLAMTNLQATRSIRDQRENTYTLDGAMDAAIQYVRVDKTRGAPASTCPTVSATVNGKSASVTCAREGPLTQIDRKINFVATVGGSSDQVRTTVIYRDAAGPAGNPAVDVVSWKYQR